MVAFIVALRMPNSNSLGVKHTLPSCDCDCYQVSFGISATLLLLFRFFFASSLIIATDGADFNVSYSLYIP